jgi:hypothetical protein
MNNEPVAWIGKDELQFGFADTRVTNEKESWDDIPLYTHPAKTLTDEEMYELLEKYQGIELCKAVLKKAQGK